MPTELPEPTAPGLQVRAPEPPKPPPPAPTDSGKMPRLWSLSKPSEPYGDLMIEPHLAPAYFDYAQNRTPESADKLLSAVSPIIDESLRSYGGTESTSVTARARAKKMALEAARRYDPSRAKLRTHLLSHLRGLRRVTERMTSGVYVPEQWKLDARHVEAVTRDARDELGREPSDAEISDRTGIPLDRVRRSRGVPGVVAASQFEGSVASNAGDDKAYKNWTEAVYTELSPIDQVILEHSFGMHAKPVLPGNKIAEMVGLSPGAVSQRRSKIQQQLDEYDAFLGRS